MRKSVTAHDAKAVVILPFVKHVWLKWSCEKGDT